MADNPKPQGMPQQMTPEEAAQDNVLNNSVARPSPVDEIVWHQQQLNEIKTSRDQLMQEIKAPVRLEEIPVPADYQANPLMAIGAMLRSIGGNSSSLDGLIAQKQRAGHYQKQVAAQNIDLRNRAALQQQDNLIAALEVDLRGKQFDYDASVSMMNMLADESLTAEDAMRLMPHAVSLYGSPASMLGTPEGFKTASIAYGLTDRTELQRRLATGPFAEPPERDPESRSLSQHMMQPFLLLMEGGQDVEVQVPLDPDDPNGFMQTTYEWRPWTEDEFHQLRFEAEAYIDSMPEHQRVRLRDMMNYGTSKRQTLLSGADERDIPSPESVLGGETGGGTEPPEQVMAELFDYDSLYTPVYNPAGPDAYKESFGDAFDRWAGVTFGESSSDRRAKFEQDNKDRVAAGMKPYKNIGEWDSERRAAARQRMHDEAFLALYPEDLKFNPVNPGGLSGRDVDRINKERARILGGR